MTIVKVKFHLKLHTKGICQSNRYLLLHPKYNKLLIEKQSLKMFSKGGNR